MSPVEQHVTQRNSNLTFKQNSLTMNEQHENVTNSSRHNSSDATNPKNNELNKTQDLTMSGLWREFQKQKRILEKLIGEDEDKFLNSCQSNTPQFPINRLNYDTNSHTTPETREYLSLQNPDYHTPVNQMGQQNYPDPQRLQTTSTPKGAYSRKQQLQATPNQSPISLTNAQYANQRAAPFDATCSSINSPPNHRIDDFSITYLGRPRNGSTNNGHRK